MQDGKRAKQPRLGFEQPRIFTPPRRELTPETSKGFEVIKFAAVLGVYLLPWERWLLIHALELNEDGTFRFRIVLLLVARQNGKSLVMQVLALWRMFMDEAKLTIGTAQNLDVAEEQWQAAVDMAQDIPELAEEISAVKRAAGKFAMRLRTGERYKVATANRKGGRGLSGDLILMDELREHTNWESWSAVSKTTLARPYAQLWAASNAGDIASVVLRFLRNQGHAALGNPDGIDGIETIEIPDEFLLADPDSDEEEFTAADALSSLAIFEWSAAPGRSKWDRTGWQEANPSMNHDMGDPTVKLTERAIAAAVATEPERVVRTEILCQWLETSVLGPFPEGQWERAQDPQSRRAEGQRVAYCVDVAHDRSIAHIGIFTRRADGQGHIEVIASRSGTGWVEPWFKERANTDDPLPVAVQSVGAPASSLLPALEQIEGLAVKPWGGGELGKGFGMFYDLLRGFNPDESSDPDSPAADPEALQTPLLWHRNQPNLNMAAAQAVTKPAGDGILLDRKNSPVDIAPLIAVIGATWLYFAHPPAVKKRSKYEDEDPITLPGSYV
jgi:hypothetical protein